MFCSKCGNENPNDSKFCGKCGLALTAANKSANRAILLILVVILVLLLLYAFAGGSPIIST